MRQILSALRGVLLFPFWLPWFHICQADWWHRFIGGHFEGRLYEAAGYHYIWDRVEPCQKDERIGPQRGNATCREYPGVGIRRHWMYLSYVARHKWFVFVAGWRDGLPWLAALHDNSKFDPREWNSYARHFYQPNGMKRTWVGKDGFYEDEEDDRAFDRAWLLHASRNKHHPQHWCTIWTSPCFLDDHAKYVLLHDDGGASCVECQIRVPYFTDMTVREMMADWSGAGLAQGVGGDPTAWYKARGYKLPLGPMTRAWIQEQLHLPADWKPEVAS